MYHFFFHYPCPDGVFSALAAKMYCESLAIGDENLRWHPMKVYKSPQEQFDFTADDTLVSKNDECFFLDYTGNLEFIVALSEICKKVVILDHHKTAQNDVEKLLAENAGGKKRENLEVIFNMEKSAAVISLEYFNKKLGKNIIHANFGGSSKDAKRLARIFEFIQDGDIWAWKMEQSREFSAGFDEFEFEFDPNVNFDIFEVLKNLDIDKTIEFGAHVLKKNEAILCEELKKSFIVNLPNSSSSSPKKTKHAQNSLQFLAVFSNHSKLRSRLGNELAQKSLREGLRGIGAVVYREADLADVGDEAVLKVSLRSLQKPIDEDTSEISRRFGGGGHKNASSFTIRESVWESWKQQ